MARVKSAKRLPAKRRARQGVCKYCRCTDARACPDGCTWANTQHTICDTDVCLVKACKDGARLYSAAASLARTLVEVQEAS